MRKILLSGLDGSNPLGFLAAVGTIRLCDRIWPAARIGMRWVRESGWRPELSELPVETEADLCHALAGGDAWVPLDAFEKLGNNLTVPLTEFADTAREIARDVKPADRVAADFLTAFGNEVYDDPDKGRIVYTDFSFITGSGHQHFLGTARALQQCAGTEHLREALFGPWRFADKSNSFRWDPEDAKEYALRWRDPSVGGAMTVWGANRLAFEALPFFPMTPTGATLRTTGFNTTQGAHEFTWPIWTTPASADTIRSLVGLRQLQPSGNEDEDRQRRHELEQMGIAEVFRARRVRIGQGANFKVSFRPGRAV